jgi:hypothetical protein
MKRINLLLLLAAMSLAGAGSAIAQDTQKGMGKAHNMPMFSDCDLNGDGVIVAEEFYEARAKRMAERAAEGGKMKNAGKAPSFKSIDTNDDGEISVEEFDVHKAEMIEKRQQRMQKN